MENENKDYKLIHIEEYTHLNRNGFPCTRGWKYKLVRREENGGEKAPFEWEKTQNNTFVKVKI